MTRAISLAAVLVLRCLATATTGAPVAMMARRKCRVVPPTSTVSGPVKRASPR